VLEANYKRLRRPQRTDADERLTKSLEPNPDELRESIYDLGVTMLRRIREGRVGRHATR
jgi:hypothetical protein